jgi:hypothetical protein
VYIAGAYRARNNLHGYNHWEQEQNIRRAEELALEVWKLGGAAVCPHLNTAHFQGALPDEVWLEGDLDILLKCDCVVLVKDWELSSGTRREVEVAVEHGIPVHGALAPFVVWMHTWQSITRS